MTRRPPLLLAALAFCACAVDTNSGVQGELKQLEQDTGDAVSKVRRALAAPELPFAELGESLRQVDVAARALQSLQTDPRASDQQRLRAALLEARSYDDVAFALADAPARKSFPIEQQAVVGRALDDQALPARTTARQAFERALSLLCSTGQSDHPALLEILDGLTRYGGSAPPAAAPCAP